MNKNEILTEVQELLSLLNLPNVETIGQALTAINWFGMSATWLTENEVVDLRTVNLAISLAGRAMYLYDEGVTPEPVSFTLKDVCVLMEIPEEYIENVEKLNKED